MSHSNLTYYVGGIAIVFTKGTLPMLYTDAYKLHLGLQHSSEPATEKKSIATGEMLQTMV